ncbi:hypothetical protein M514_06454 [Trichuris suis]|uniref:Uncharacterized protein n=1 Tax=Trichuris suis TaxID=68888 RepID=A0A085M5W1_9BILA|nr:hypothetical protein M513_06454 [Trichuris suis]KFD63503.1 hypothetical protein M514_06454 [Trichuris suis]
MSPPHQHMQKMSLTALHHEDGLFTKLEKEQPPDGQEGGQDIEERGRREKKQAMDKYRDR